MTCMKGVTTNMSLFDSASSGSYTGQVGATPEPGAGAAALSVSELDEDIWPHDDEPVAEEPRTWTLYALTTAPDGTVSGLASTNDDDDDGVADSMVAQWELHYASRDAMLQMTGGTHRGMLSDVIVVLDGMPVWRDHAADRHFEAHIDLGHGWEIRGQITAPSAAEAAARASRMLDYQHEMTVDPRRISVNESRSKG